MTIERKTVIDQIEICRTGEMRVRIGLLLVEDGVEIDCRWHRTTINPDTDPVVQMANVNEHLAFMGKQPVPADDLENLKEYHALYKDIAQRKAPKAEQPVKTK